MNQDSTVAKPSDEGSGWYWVRISEPVPTQNGRKKDGN